MKSTSFSLTQVDLDRLAYIQRHTGIPKAAIVRYLLRALAAGDDICGCPTIPSRDEARAELDHLAEEDTLVP